MATWSVLRRSSIDGSLFSSRYFIHFWRVLISADAASLFDVYLHILAPVSHTATPRDAMQ